MIIPPDAFLTIGNTISSIRTIEGQRAITFFKTTYGINHEVCSHTWELMTMYQTKPRRSNPKHLLWALILLKSYGTEIFLARLWGTNEKTFRKWSWRIIEGISLMHSQVVSKKWFIV
jgi:hypothetical protein